MRTNGNSSITRVPYHDMLSSEESENHNNNKMHHHHNIGGGGRRITVSDLDVEAAETDLILSLEENDNRRQQQEQPMVHKGQKHATGVARSSRGHLQNLFLQQHQQQQVPPPPAPANEINGNHHHVLMGVPDPPPPPPDPTIIATSPPPPRSRRKPPLPRPPPPPPPPPPPQATYPQQDGGGEGGILQGEGLLQEEETEDMEKPERRNSSTTESIYRMFMGANTAGVSGVGVDDIGGAISSNAGRPDEEEKKGSHMDYTKYHHPKPSSQIQLGSMSDLNLSMDENDGPHEKTRTMKNRRTKRTNSEELAAGTMIGKDDEVRDAVRKLRLAKRSMGSFPELGIVMDGNDTKGVFDTASTNQQQKKNRIPSPKQGNRHRDLLQQQQQHQQQQQSNSTTTQPQHPVSNHRRKISRAHAVFASLQDATSDTSTAVDNDFSFPGVFFFDQQRGKRTSPAAVVDKKKPVATSTSASTRPSPRHVKSKSEASLGERLPLLQNQHFKLESSLQNLGIMGHLGSGRYDRHDEMNNVSDFPSGEPTLPSDDSQRNPGDDDGNVPFVVTASNTNARRLVLGKRSASSSNKRTGCFYKMMKYLCMCCLSVVLDPCRVLVVLYRHVICSATVLIAIPLFALNWILHHRLGNPSLDFLPGTNIIASWLDFIGRQIITFELSHLINWWFIDCLVLGKGNFKLRKRSLRLFGSFMVLLIIGSKGWPSIATTWGILDLLLLHGNNDFQTDWLYLTNWRVFNGEGIKHIINSEIYLRFLVSLIVAGVATSLKRAFLTIYFGQRQLAEFKARFAKLLRDAIVLGEIAVLAQDAVEVTDSLIGGGVTGAAVPSNSMDATASVAPDVDNDNDSLTFSTHFVGSIRTPSKKVGKGVSFSGNVVDVGGADPKKDRGLAREFSKFSFDHDPSEEESLQSSFAGPLQSESDFDAARSSPQSPPKPQHLGGGGMMRSTSTNSVPNAMMPSDVSTSLGTSTGAIRVVNLLDSWEEPKDKTDKTSRGTLEDVLKFDRALDYLEETQKPFGEDFGLAANRNQCIESAHELYNRLLLLQSDKTALHFSTLSLVIERDDEGEPYTFDDVDDETKYKVLRKRFPLDANDNISKLDFIQTCDTIYKSLRYFRASVNNASVIDKVLEDMINCAFYFVLVLIISSFMKVNVYAMFVSVASMLVSVSFALGASVSKFVEGLILIAVRRPYDLGDRIVISDPSSHDDDPGPTQTWLVEEINLFYTKLRYAKTNQVSTVMNWSIFSSRIVNYNRSPNALVYVELQTSTTILTDNKLPKFRIALDDYIKKNTKIWDCLTIFRTDLYNADIEKVTLVLSFRHRSGWQNAGRIMIHRADLLRYIHETAVRMNIHFETAPGRRVFYQGGELDDAHADDYKKEYASRRHIIKRKQN